MPSDKSLAEPQLTENDSKFLLTLVWHPQSHPSLLWSGGDTKGQKVMKNAELEDAFTEESWGTGFGNCSIMRTVMGEFWCGSHHSLQVKLVHVLHAATLGSNPSGCCFFIWKSVFCYLGFEYLYYEGQNYLECCGYRQHPHQKIIPVFIEFITTPGFLFMSSLITTTL